MQKIDLHFSRVCFFLAWEFNKNMITFQKKLHLYSEFFFLKMGSTSRQWDRYVKDIYIHFNFN